MASVQAKNPSLLTPDISGSNNSRHEAEVAVGTEDDHLQSVFYNQPTVV